MNLSYILLLWPVIMGSSVNSRNQINITIMVPGIEAYRILTNEASKLDVFHQHENHDADHYEGYYYENEEFVNNLLATFNIDASSQFNDVPVYENEVYDDSTHFDIERFLKEHHHTYSWSYVFVKPALDLALEDIKKLNILKGYHFNLCYYDTGNEIGRTSDRF